MSANRKFLSLRGAAGDEAISFSGKDCFATLLRNKMPIPKPTRMAARHSGRAERDPESRQRELDARLRADLYPLFCNLALTLGIFIGFFRKKTRCIVKTRGRSVAVPEKPQCFHVRVLSPPRRQENMGKDQRLRGHDGAEKPNLQKSPENRE